MKQLEIKKDCINAIMRRLAMELPFPVSKSAIRFYERQGLIKPQRWSDNTYRIYTEQEYKTLRSIFILSNIGFSLKEIRRYITGENRDDIKKQARTRLDEIAIAVEKGAL